MGILSSLMGHSSEANIEQVEEELEQILSSGEEITRAYKL